MKGLPTSTERLMVAAAKSAGTSKSKWVADVIRARARNDWPPFVQALAGAWADMPEAAKIRARQPKDAKRERL